MSYAHDILEELWNTSLSYKGMRVNVFGIPVGKNKKSAAFNTALHRLRTNEYIEEKSEKYILTTKGKKYVEKKLAKLETFDSPFRDVSVKNLLVMFDIPETRKAEREWFRWHLKRFGYVMIQKSVWVGPSPLPKKFTDYTKSIGLKNAIKTIKLAKSYNK